MTSIRSIALACSAGLAASIVALAAAADRPIDTIVADINRVAAAHVHKPDTPDHRLTYRASVSPDGRELHIEESAPAFPSPRQYSVALADVGGVNQFVTDDAITVLAMCGDHSQCVTVHGGPEKDEARRPGTGIYIAKDRAAADRLQQLFFELIDASKKRAP